MSDPAGTILLTDSPEEAAKKSCPLPRTPLVSYIWIGLTSPALATCSLLAHCYLAKDLAAEWDSKTNYGDLKAVVAAEVQQFLTRLTD